MHATRLPHMFYGLLNSVAGPAPPHPAIQPLRCSSSCSQSRIASLPWHVKLINDSSGRTLTKMLCAGKVEVCFSTAVPGKTGWTGVWDNMFNFPQTYFPSSCCSWPFSFVISVFWLVFSLISVCWGHHHSAFV